MYKIVLPANFVKLYFIKIFGLRYNFQKDVFVSYVSQKNQLPLCLSRGFYIYICFKILQFQIERVKNNDLNNELLLSEPDLL